ncbi:hypothetical protein IQA49_13235 [Leptospira borgpetersenii serovar Ballum]|uniref:hypothetical protein n=2 Tax=Leptospira borgpetersenii TaxID=174 RepID=UPI00131F4F22|nr:hypothetical protein [Leptospira borgpetersenii]MBE8213863.1 hypothetical protein [Leptospira borgpetersenii serovar Ballum]MBE8265661.1 hypothetical protein [Leptospira borgpetersenii serovar Ballum]MBE8272049.1 hypothetical protein [Leptospira borgpetersenii serovar Ballum]MBE8300722.1 hypothetical protein [Leptospira borgpetersenii serovar Ballum]QHE27068.1 hypothetical protein GS524_08745 [Leptospira borgpetersenii]
MWVRLWLPTGRSAGVAEPVARRIVGVPTDFFRSKYLWVRLWLPTGRSAGVAEPVARRIVGVPTDFFRSK